MNWSRIIRLANWSLTILLLWTAATTARADRKRLLRRSPRGTHMSLVASQDGYWFSEGGKKIMFYQRVEKSQQGKWARSNYIHPLYDLDGNEVTEDFPKDHPHHRGIYWAWHQIFAGQQRLGDAWVASDFIADVVQSKIIQADSEAAALRVEVHWKSPLWTDANKQPRPFLKETTVIRAHRAVDNRRLIDFDIQLQALVPDLHLGGSENAKGYSGFSARIKHPRETVFNAEQGPVQPQTTGLAAGPWIDMAGAYSKGDAISGIGILCHPKYPQGKQLWILRSKSSMQNAAYPGQHAKPVLMDKPWHLKYRLVLHRGDTAGANFPRLQKEFAAQP
ncbi:MAG: DUF6807 family protein [Pirellulaceae bacterium]